MLRGWAAVAGICMALAGCDVQKAEQTAPPAPPAVVVAKVEQRDVVPYEIRTGALAANQYVKILPRVSGFIATIPFKPGAFVKTGAVLFTLDARPFNAQLEQTRANLKVQEASLQNAQDEADRQERLAKQDASTEKDLMNARNNLRAATAAVASAKAAVDAAQLNVDYCTIASPINGKVDINAVDVGDLVSSADQKPLTTVAEIDPIRVDFTFPEGLIVEFLKRAGVDPNKKLAMPVKVSLGMENDYRYDATLNFLSNTLDQSTGTVVAQATAKNTDMKLYPGLFVRVKVDLPPLKDALLIREDAVARDIGGDFIWIIKPDNTAEKRYVKLGTLVESQRVVKSGAAAGETYVIQGMQRVRDRAKVTPKPAADVASTQPAS